MSQCSDGLRSTLGARSGWVALALSLVIALPQVAAAQTTVGVEGTFLIRGGTVVVGTGERLANNDVLIQDGRIARIAPSISAPAGAVEIDATGRFVYAGMIESNAQVGLTEISGISQMNATSELGEFNPHIRALVALNIGSVMYGITRSTGVLSVVTSPTGGMVSGQAALINMDGWTWEDMAVDGNVGYVLNLPGGGRGGRGGGRGGRGGAAPTEDSGDDPDPLDMIRNEVFMARGYHAAREMGEGKVDLIYESMKELIDGEAPFIVNANSEAQIQTALDLAEELDVRIVIRGGNDAWRLREELAEAQVPVILNPMTRTPPRDMPYDAVYAQPGILVEAGVKIAFSAGSASNARHVPYEAALATAFGLSLEDAWKALTIWPAEIWGVDDQIGTVEEGKMANIIVTDGDPLDIRTNVHEIFIKGRHVPMDDRATQLYEKFNARPMPGRGGGG